MTTAACCILVTDHPDERMTWCGKKIDEEASRFPQVPGQIPNLASDEVCGRCANVIILKRLPRS